MAAWRKLAGELRIAPRFIEQGVAPFVDRALEAVADLARAPEHDDPIVPEIADGIYRRAENGFSTRTPP